MSLSYNTYLPQRMAVPTRQQAMRHLAPLPGGQYGAAYGDNARALSMESLSGFGRAADQANFEYDVAAHKGQQGLALSGLQNMAQEQQRQQDFGNRRLQTMLGALRGLM